MANMAAKVLLQPIRSDTAPQNKRPSALKILTRPKSGAIAAAETLSQIGEDEHRIRDDGDAADDIDKQLQPQQIKLRHRENLRG